MKKIALIGSTGSIGRQALAVAARHPARFRVVAMAANKNERLFAEQIAAYRPAFAALRAEGQPVAVPRGVRFARGEAAFEEACAFAEADVVLVAVSGFAGLTATLAAIEAGKDVALANKESLVVGGELVLARARAKGVDILPVDPSTPPSGSACTLTGRLPFPASCSRRAAAPCETCLLQSFLRSRQSRRSPTRTGIWAQRSP